MIENPVKVNLSYKQLTDEPMEYSMKSESFPCCSSVTKREYIIPINGIVQEFEKEMNNKNHHDSDATDAITVIEKAIYSGLSEHEDVIYLEGLTEVQIKLLKLSGYDFEQIKNKTKINLDYGR